MVEEGSKISIHPSKATTLVLQSFIVEVTPTETEEEFFATSHISNSYELGATPDAAVRNYLELVVDELIWLQNHEESLSPSLHEDLHTLQSYLRIV